MAIAIRQDFIPGYEAYPMTPKYITIHNTANTSKGAGDEMHARYLNNGAGGRTVSWHFTVDDDSVTQHLPVNVNGWHAGDGLHGKGNRESIGIEICENSDGDFSKAVANAVELVQHLMKAHGISIMNVVPHKHWSGKNCPRKLLADWDGLVARFKNEQSAPAVKAEKVERKPNPKVEASKLTLHLPANEDSWRVYPTNKAPVVGNEVAFLNPKKFGGLEYVILDNPMTDVYTIKTSDFGKVNIFASKETGATISGHKIEKPAKKKQYVKLPASSKSWRAYPLSKAPVKGNEKAKLNPAKFGGLEYEVLRYSQANVAVIKSQQFGEVQIYVAPSTGAIIETK
jgi:N-acetylmuramoyl-L-alanine amidase